MLLSVTKSVLLFQKDRAGPTWRRIYRGYLIDKVLLSSGSTAAPTQAVSPVRHLLGFPQYGRHNAFRLPFKPSGWQVCISTILPLG